MNTRNSWVDFAKFIGIILVVYGHVSRGIVASGIIRDNHIFASIDSIIYSFHMPLFFFLSGMFVQSSLNKHGPRNFLASKFDTILYPYMIWSVIQGAVQLILSSATNSEMHISDIYAIFWRPIPPFWFLFALLLFSLLVAASFRIFHRTSAFVWMFLGALAYLCFGHRTFSAPALEYFAKFFVFFAAGSLLKPAAESRFLGSWLGMITSFLSFGFLQYLLHFYCDLKYTDYGALTLLTASISIAFFVSFSRIATKLHLPKILFVGQNTMPIYVIHILAGSGARIVLSKILHVESPIIHISVGMLCGISAPLCILLIANRIGFRHLTSYPICKFFNRSQSLTTRT